MENGPIEIVDFPIKHGDFPLLFVGSPEANHEALRLHGMIFQVVETGRQCRRLDRLTPFSRHEAACHEGAVMEHGSHGTVTTRAIGHIQHIPLLNWWGELYGI